MGLHIITINVLFWGFTKKKIIYIKFFSFLLKKTHRSTHYFFFFDILDFFVFDVILSAFVCCIFIRFFLSFVDSLYFCNLSECLLLAKIVLFLFFYFMVCKWYE